MTISVQMDFDTGLHVLYVRSHGMSAMPAGPRLFHLPKLAKAEHWAAIPDIQWSHESAEAANKDAAKLRKYLEGLPERRQSKRELRVGA